MAGALLDEAIAQVGSKQWNLRPLQEATAGIKACSEPITLSDFIDGACRPLAKGIESNQSTFSSMLIWESHHAATHRTLVILSLVVASLTYLFL